MDDRFPKWLRLVVRKLDFLGIPNLPTLIIGLAILGFVGQNFMNAPLYRFAFDPIAVRGGEWYRLFAFPIDQAVRDPIFFFFYVLYIFFIFSSIMQQWAPGPTTVFTLFSYICAIVASLVTNQPTFIWLYVIQNVSLAFATLFPDLELYILFVIPVRAKWLGLIWGAAILYEFFVEPDKKVLLAIAMLPYCLFFFPMHFKNIRMKLNVRRNRNRMDQ